MPKREQLVANAQKEKQSGCPTPKIEYQLGESPQDQPKHSPGGPKKWIFALST
ncbi:uncharacterized protein DS421_18g623310 [Arachis hypogaea]|nr:uncharacterized protein DS421_18g623310 [Arachis hypogaea]